MIFGSMNEFIAFVSIIICGFFLASCEGNTDYYFEVRNNCSTQIFVKSVNWSSDTVILKIASGAQGEVLQEAQRGGVKNPENLGDYLIHLEIYNNLGVPLNYDPINNKYWSRSTEVRSKIPANYGHSYLLEVSENHF